MEILKNFFECYFNQTADYADLNKIIKELKSPAEEKYRLQLITELHQIIQSKSYELVARIMKKYGNRSLFNDLEKTEKFINFLYDRFTDGPTDVKAEDFEKKIKGVFCPVCCPNPKVASLLNLIEKATITSIGQQIFICKPCKLVWLTEDIKADNAQDYKKFMKTLGLKGLWKELRDVDIL